MQRICLTRMAAAILFFTVFTLLAPTVRATELPDDMPEWNAAQREMLAQFCAARCEGEPFLCKVATVCCLLNRVRDSRFPGDLTTVLVDAGYSAAPVKEAEYRSALWAIRCARMGPDPTGGSVLWARAGTADSAGIRLRLAAGSMIFGVPESDG